MMIIVSHPNQHFISVTMLPYLVPLKRRTPPSIQLILIPDNYTVLIGQAYLNYTSKNENASTMRAVCIHALKKLIIFFQMSYNLSIQH